MSDIFLGLILFFLCLILCALIFKVIVSTVKRQGIWGINFIPPNCPGCGEKLPMVRTPTSFRQAMEGGATCTSCGCEADKWGKEIKVLEYKNTRKQIKETQTDFIKPFDIEGRTPVEKVFDEK